jgi:hypothetical protein
MKALIGGGSETVDHRSGPPSRIIGRMQLRNLCNGALGGDQMQVDVWRADDGTALCLENGWDERIHLEAGPGARFNLAFGGVAGK